MDKDKNMEWLKEKLNKGKEEVVKLTKIGKIKLEVASNKRKLEEKIKNLGIKVLTLKKEGTDFPDTLEDDFESIFQLEEKIKELEDLIVEIKKSHPEEADEEDIEEADIETAEVVEGEVVEETEQEGEKEADKEKKGNE
ncbi:MAG: hypothetical protein H5U39_07570 [Deferribacterales bacterium]|nr:hypothetical protein [Deferribacterales bacterium]